MKYLCKAKRWQRKISYEVSFVRIRKEKPVKFTGKPQKKNKKTRVILSFIIAAGRGKERQLAYFSLR
jgi:acyl-coenzyme A thioesterase PaaI-like protein